ncbi:TPA: hypothetical protein N0F65_002768 [Lagenidium giganteum]|uniref:DNA/pantothenate metabolism flavoprotein C-terminal domain-containing protein n=1 Tax=Lagenidium giganteum TaxID=4803 RepID=A0AAV2YKI7_9STRA|nr:TPA: hypothetical protein N0F65_002768 [Lagenidium giganteum]
MEGEDVVATYFKKTPAPPALSARREDVLDFLEHHSTFGQCVAIVTSGGTTVPLEKNTVRFLDNFSTGSRGAASAEYFLKLGYAVIYLHRPGSIAPFARHFQKALSSHLDLQFLDHVGPTRGAASASPLQLQFDDDVEEKLAREALADFRRVQDNRSLLALPFTSVDEYFFLLKMVAECVEPIKERALFFLAAAVSDFFIPQHSLSEHKIQSRAGPLELRLEQVPKLLGVLRHTWAPQAFFVSFKLETDWDILRQKAKQSISRYGMHLVVANELKSRFREVLVITSDDERVLTKPEEDHDIESALINAVAEVHYKYIASKGVSVPDDVGKKITSFRSWRRRLPPAVQRAIGVLDAHQEEIAAVVLGGLLSVALNMLQTALLRRQRH